jgi:hypothetical protein
MIKINKNPTLNNEIRNKKIKKPNDQKKTQRANKKESP